MKLFIVWGFSFQQQFLKLESYCNCSDFYTDSTNIRFLVLLFHESLIMREKQHETLSAEKNGNQLQLHGRYSIPAAHFLSSYDHHPD